MSKSIYEEALKIIDRNFEFNHGHIVLGVSGKTKIEQALKQAQKQDKLLELYKELMTVKDELMSLLWFDAPSEEMEEKEAYLEQQIKELLIKC